MNRLNEYRGITYPKILQHKIILKLWKKFMCSHEKHLLDEVSSLEEHYLYCDVCGLEIHIERITKDKK